MFYPFYKLNPYGIRKYLGRWLSLITKTICFILNIKRVVKGKKLTENHQNFLVVGNHLSYLDIFVLSSIYPVSFITSFEMKETLGVGFLTEMAGCVFVERRKEKRDPNDRLKELKDIEKSLANGVSVALYAEATTGDGTGVLPFRKPMFQPAMNQNTPVLLHVVNYTKINGEPVDQHTKDFLFWYGEMTMADHFFKVLTFFSVEVEVNFLEILETSDFEDIEALTNRSHKAVEAAYRPILVSSHN